MKNSQMKNLFLFLFFLLAAAAPLFSQSDLLPSGLQTTATSIQNIFTGPIVTVILVCCLAGCGIAYAFNKDNEKMKRNIIAIAIGIIIVGCAASIVQTIFNAAGG